jgi:hypothetical protein
MNTPLVADTSLWIYKSEECTLSGGLLSPHFIPKVTSITVEYDSLFSRFNGMDKYFVFILFVYIIIYIIIHTYILFIIYIFSLLVVNIDGKLLLGCGLKVEGRLGKDNENGEVLEIDERSTEEKAVVIWPSSYENEKNVDWYVRVMYGENMKQVCIRR